MVAANIDPSLPPAAGQKFAESLRDAPGLKPAGKNPLRSKCENLEFQIFTKIFLVETGHISAL
jgi:hypothetical protein